MKEFARQNPTGSSEAHRDSLLKHPLWHRATSVLLYAPLPGEPDPMLLLPHQDTRRFVFPRIEGAHLALYQVTQSSRWMTGPFGVREPDPLSSQKVLPQEIDLALIPGLAFDHSGGRLGRGKGYYDRLLGAAGFHGVKIGFCWSWQIVPEVPRSNLDILMDGILTEENLLMIQS